MDIRNDPRVDKEIRNLPLKESSRIVKVIDLFKDYEFTLSQKYLKKLQTNLWELRAGRYRLLFGFVFNKAVITHIFMKKTQKTQRQEIELAEKRLKAYEQVTI